MNAGGQFQVGQRVRTTDGTRSTGEIVDDYGSLAGTEVVVDGATAVRGRRWAVQLDDGGLQFLDDDGIEPSLSG
jgi:hypothetical protein